MSQVIVTNDKFKAERLASGKQERAITHEAIYQKWRMNRIDGRSRLFDKAFGILFLPVLLLWGLLLGGMAFALYLFTKILSVLGRVFQK